MSALGRRGRKPTSAYLARIVLVRLCCAAALLLGGGPSAWAQEGSAPTSTAESSLPTSIPLKRETGSGADAANTLRWTLMALFIAGLAGWSLVAVRRGNKKKAASGTGLSGWFRLAQGGAPQEIRQITSTKLTPRHSLHVVEWNGRKLLLGCTDQSVQLLSEEATAPSQEARSS